MPTSYPGAVDSFGRPVSGAARNVAPTETDSFDSLMDAVEAIETELGTDPSGVEATVKDRIAAAETDIATKAAEADAVMDGDAAGGVLSGTYPSPGFAVDMATQAELNAVAAAAVNDGDAAGGVLAGTYPNPSFAADMATQAELDAHINDTSAAHAASAISIADVANDFTATDVEGALAELQSDHEADATALSDHIADTTAAHAASAISYAGGTGMSATDVEAAIDELATEKADTASAVMDGDTAGGVLAGTYPNPSFAVDMATQAELNAVAAAAVNDGDAAGGVLSGTYPNPGFAVDMATQAELDAHVNDTSAAHAASAISYAGGTGMSATDVEAAVDELATEKADKSAIVLPDTHTWAVAGEIKVPVGDTDFLVPFFVFVPTGWTAVVSRCRYVINSGTSVTAKLQKNGVDLTGFTGISVTTTAATTNPADQAIADTDKLALVVTAVAGTPKNLSFSVELRLTLA